MKSWILGLLLIWQTAHAKAYLVPLARESQRIIGLIKKAQTCTPAKRNNRFEMCTGYSITEVDLKKFEKLDLKECKDFIGRLGIKVLPASKAPDKSFTHSTKRAQIYWDTKAAYLKDSAGKIDCLHELLHVYQRHRPYKGELNPIARKQIELGFLHLLEQQVAEIEKIEKAGNKERAGKMARNLQPFIQLLGKWRELVNWLDEKEIYYFIYHNCDRLKCTDEDADIALTNLYRLRNHFSWREREEIEERARELLRKKEERAYRLAFLEWKNKDKLTLLKSAKPQAFYDRQLKEGSISRQRFEELALRSKFLHILSSLAILNERLENPKLAHERKRQLYLDKLSFEAQINFDKDKVEGESFPVGSILKYSETIELPAFSYNGKRIVLDLGAMDSVIDPQALPFGLDGLRSDRIKFLQTADGKSLRAPMSIFPVDISLGGGSLKNSLWALADLKLPKVSGLVGLNAFKNSDFILDTQKRTLVVTRFKKRPQGALPIQRDQRGEIRAVEFVCPDKSIFRLDTGSQVTGDLGRMNLNPKAYRALTSPKGLKCGSMSIRGNFHQQLDNGTLFSRGVGVNLGWPWIKKFKQIKISLRKGWVQFL